MHLIYLKEKTNIGLFNINIRYDLIHQAILWQQLCKRKNISNTKSVAKVSGSTRKIYKQKGTGRARHGSIKSICFVGGGVAFGPMICKSYKIKINKKIKKKALLHSIALKYQTNDVILVRNINILKLLFRFKQCLKNKSILFIDVSFEIDLIRLISNFYNFNSLNIEGLNVFDIVKHEKIICSSITIKNILNNIDEKYRRV